MRRNRKTEPIEESIRLSSEVTIIVRASAAVYDTLDIQRVGGVVTVALPGAQRPKTVLQWGSPAAGEISVDDTPVDPEAIAAARAALPPRSRAVTADELAAQSGFDTGAIQRSIAAAMETPYAGVSNEDEPAHA